MSLAKSESHLGWHYICGAVLDTFRHNQINEEHRGIKASSDDWATCEMLRKETWEAVRQRWCSRTGEPPQDFPYSEDGVARLYFRFRKRNPEEIAAFEREIDQANR